MLLQTQHPSLKDNEKTRLSASASDGDTTIDVANTTGFSQNDYIVVGEPGLETTEAVKVNAAVSDDHQLTVTAIKHDHNEDEPVYFTKYNQVKFYRATSESGTYSLVATEDIDWNQPKTYYEDSAGSSSNWAKTTYYNDVTTTESSYSDAVPYTSLGFTRVGDLIERARRATNTVDDYNYISDDEIIDVFNEVEDRLTVIGNFEYGETSATESTVADQQAYDLPSDYKEGSIVKLRFNEGTSYRYPDYISFREFQEKYDTDSTSTVPTHYTIYGGQFLLYPTPSASGSSDLTLFYQKDPTDLEGEYDAVTYPWTHIYMARAKEYINRKKGNDNVADSFGAKYESYLSEVLAVARNRARDGFGKVRSRDKDLDIQLGTDPDEITLS